MQMFVHPLRYGIIYGGQGKENNSIFKLQERFMQIVNGVNEHTPCRWIFKNSNIRLIDRYLKSLAYIL